MKKQLYSKTVKSARRNLRLIMAESAVTAGLLAMSVFTPFFNSIGLNNQQISEVQICFTIVVMILNIPMGYIADRISRKWANIIGDFGHAVILLIYSQVASFAGAVICECLCGIAHALSDGVDQSLIKHFVGKISQETGESENKLLRTKTAKLEVYKQSCNLLLLILGGPIGAISLRLALALSSVNYFIGGIVSIFIEDDSEKLRPNHKNPFKDIYEIMKTAIKNQPLRTRIFAYAVGREMTHGIIWIVTPLFLKAGIPMEVVSFAWAFNSLMCILGANLAVRYGKNLSDAKIMAIPVALMSISMFVMGLHLSLATVWLYGAMGVIQGWTAATLTPMVQKYAKPSEQTSILSVTKTLSQLLYIPVVWIIGYVADIKLEYGLFATLIIFLPLGLIIIKKLKQDV